VRHRVYGKKLGRTKNQRTALFKNLVQSLLIHEKIQTTETKAKAIKGLIDKIINQAKTESTRRLVSQFLVSKKTQERLITELLPRLSGRNSGYTSTVKIGQRLGDGAMLVSMSLLLSEQKKAEKKPLTKEAQKEEAPVIEAAKENK
jgi:large subunit ribosomal protein L17